MWDETSTKRKVSNWHLNACPWKAWLLFHFWRHHFYQNWITCTQARPFQWYPWPDESDWVNARDMHENGQKLEWKFGENFLSTTLGFSVLMLFRKFLNRKQAEKINNCSKKIRTGWKGEVKKNETAERRRSFSRPKPFEILITAPSRKEIS